MQLINAFIINANPLEKLGIWDENEPLFYLQEKIISINNKKLYYNYREKFLSDMRPSPLGNKWLQKFTVQGCHKIILYFWNQIGAKFQKLNFW